MDDDPPYDISITRLCDAADVADRQLVRTIEATLRRFAVKNAVISVAIIDDGRIADLNEKHLGHTGPTDVLTFDLRDDAAKAAPSPYDQIDGEIVVSIDTAAREAAARGHTLDAELSLYLAHGTLHLLGHDDDSPENAQKMHILENEVLSSIGVGPVFGRTSV